MKNFSLAFLMLLIIDANSMDTSSCVLGEKHYRNYEFKEAISQFKICLSKDQEDIKVLSMLGSSYYQLGNYSEAERLSLIHI